MPAMGATTNGDERGTFPIFMPFDIVIRWVAASICADIRSVDLDADRLADQVDREHQTRVRSLANEPADDTLQRTVDDLDHRALPNQGTRIVGEVAFDQLSNAVDFIFGDRRRLALERHDVDDAGALQHGQPLAGIEPGKAVSGKQRPIDLLLPILPAAPAGDRRQKCLDPFALQLLPYHLFVPRACPKREPGVVHPASTFRRSASACSYAFCNSSLRHVIVAWVRSRSRYFMRSLVDFSPATRLLMSLRASSNDRMRVSVRDSSFRI